jgi:TolB-like protein/Tfp pilus assembly protein PilF
MRDRIVFPRAKPVWNTSCSEAEPITMNAAQAEVAEPKGSISQPLQHPSSAQVLLPAPAGRARKVWPALVFAIVALALGFGLWNLSRRLAPQITAPVSPESAYLASFPEKSIAVLPFAEKNGGGAQISIGKSLHDDIISALARVADLRVISRTSVMTYAPDRPRNLPAIAQELGAGHILEGTVSSAGERVHLTLQLTDARTGERRWSVSYALRRNDVFAIQTDVVQRITSDLHAVISPNERTELGERPTRDLVAYGLYVWGKELIATVANADINDKLVQAVKVLGEATTRDPKFYLAWCQLGAAHNYIYFFGFDHSTARLALAEEALNQAIRLRPEAGETHLARANFLYRCHLNYDEARAELALAQRSAPNHSESFELAGYIDRRQGLWAESARSLQRALELDPRNSSLLQQIAASYQELHQFRAMAAALDRALALTPEDLDAQITRAFVDLEWQGDMTPLQKTIDRLVARNPDYATKLADQWFYLALCQRDPAAIVRALAAVPPSGTANDLNFPHSYCEALAARTQGNVAAARSAFLVARAEMEKIIRNQPDYGPGYTILGLIDAGLGEKEKAIEEGRRAVELLPITRDSIDGAELMKYLAVIYAWCGEKDRAIEQIGATLRVPSTLSYGNLKLHPYWDALRSDPRFEEIVTGLAPKTKFHPDAG